jgi:hypothetical protein
MISNAASATRNDLDSAQAALNFSKDGGRSAAAPAAWVAGKAPSPEGRAGDRNYASHKSVYAAQSESLYMKYTSRDGDVLEVRAESSEEIHYEEDVRVERGVRGGYGSRNETRTNALTGPAASVAGPVDAASHSELAPRAGQADSADQTDPKAQQLAQLRDWAKGVERELRQQQQKILTQMLKRNGTGVEAGEGRYLMLFVSASADGTPIAKNGGDEEDAQVPDYWNAENTSDRIVHFATQMAEICGLSPDEMADSIRKAVGAGFDQAAAITGALPGAAGKLNRDTKDLVFSKLSKWLEDRQSKAYNQGTQSGSAPADNASTLEVPYGIENHQQFENRPVHS